MTTIAHDPTPPVDPDLLAAFRDVSTATSAIASTICRSCRVYARVIGAAVTVRVRAGDSLAIHRALERSVAVT